MRIRPLTAEQVKDAVLIARALPGVDSYRPDRGIFHFAGGPYWPTRLRRFADLYEKAIPALRRMADHMEAVEPREEES